MKLTLKELNEMYYCLNIAITHYSEHKLLDANAVNNLIDKVRDEIDMVIYEMDSNEDDEPEYDSAGFTEDDRIVNGQYRVISNEDADADYKASLQQDEQRYENQYK
jgi:hypothetical protein